MFEPEDNRFTDHDYWPGDVPIGKGAWKHLPDGSIIRVWKCEACDSPSDGVFGGQHLCVRCHREWMAVEQAG